MPAWYLKAIPQKILSLLPGGEYLHRWTQRSISRSLDINSFLLEDRLSHVTRHMTAWNKYGTDRPPVCLEIGTGWFPIVPLGMALCGAKTVFTTDVQTHTNDQAHRHLFQAVLECAEEGKLRTYLPDLQESRWELFKELYECGKSTKYIFFELNIQFEKSNKGQLPSTLPPIDLIHSNNTFEHIPLPHLSNLLPAHQEVLQPDGLCSHYIDLTDHYSYFDPSLSPYHFLRFSTSAWRLIENRFQSQNRLRVNEWRELCKEAGLDILEEDNESGKQGELDQIRLHQQYASYPEKDLLVRYTHLIMKP